MGRVDGNLTRLARSGQLLLLLGIAQCVCVSEPTVAFRCRPNKTDQCPADYKCCSDDGTDVDGKLVFAGDSNANGGSGMCVQSGSIPLGSGLDERPACPPPCNPTWSPSTIADVCGPTRVCCQTVEVTEEDCVLDEATGQLRVMDGGDALAAAMSGADGWGVEGGTHQDPDFEGCERFAGDRTSDAFLACVSLLTTAAGRGYCMQLGAGQTCPTADPEYRDACELLNDG